MHPEIAHGLYTHDKGNAILATGDRFLSGSPTVAKHAAAIFQKSPRDFLKLSAFTCTGTGWQKVGVEGDWKKQGGFSASCSQNPAIKRSLRTDQHLPLGYRRMGASEKKDLDILFVAHTPLAIQSSELRDQ